MITQFSGVYVIDSSTNKVVDNITVGGEPIAIAFSPSNKDMYVVNEVSGTVSVIDSSTNKVVDTIRVEEGPLAIAYNPNNKNMYVANYYPGTVSVINSSTNTVIQNQGKATSGIEI